MSGLVAGLGFAIGAGVAVAAALGLALTCERWWRRRRSERGALRRLQHRAWWLR